MISTDFDLAALFEALDAQRQARGLTWSQALREINRASERRARHQIARSTVTGLRTRRVAEGDGVLQMLQWLNRTPESFVPGCELAGSNTAKLPEVAPQQMLRFDTHKLHAALNERRIEKGITWQQVAKEIGGVSAGSLTYLSKGSRVGFPGVMRIVRWLGRPVAQFTRLCNR
ncbi:MAG TPA: hypothetical protein VKU01_32775 [Bryobacteraceae bacterium]|nr:hypothetical protein [Bryobacteraceae bacterium]